jgi:hypothetical protein
MKDTCTHFIAACLPFSLTTAIPMAESDASVNGRDPESGVSESLGQKNSAGKVYGPCQLPRPPPSESEF